MKNVTFNINQHVVLGEQTYAITKKMGLALAMALVIGIGAQIRFYLPFSPVPVTLQTLVVLMGAYYLRGLWSSVGVMLYIVLGALGLPMFAGFGSGLGYIAGPTGGYLIGFIFAAFVLGKLFDKYGSKNWLLSLLFFAFASIIIYSIGLTQLYIWSNFVANNQMSIIKLLQIGLIPFLIGDIVKIVLAANILRVKSRKM